MKEFIKKTIGIFRSEKETDSDVTGIRITPEWIDTLKKNEIFVFGCRNSGRHFDGASNFALNHFGAVMG